MDETGERVERRALLRTLGFGAAAASAAAVSATAWARPAAAGDGDPLLLGESNDATNTTNLHVEDTVGPALNVSNGTGTGDGVRAVAAETGVSGHSNAGGHGVYGTSFGTFGAESPAGVYGYGNGRAVGVKAESETGDAIDAHTAASANKAAVRARTEGSSSAVVATAVNGYGIDARSDLNHGVVGRASATGKAAVHGIGSTSAAGVLGRASAGPGVEGVSTQAVGGVFTGATAAVRLAPQAAAGAPTGGFHQRGELLVDVNGVLFFCKTEGTPGVWKKVKLVDA